MYKKEYFKKSPAREFLGSLLGKYTLEPGMKVAEVNNIIEQIRLKLNTYEYAPKFVITRALYEDSVGGVTSARFVVRPSVKFELNVKDMKKVFLLVGNADFFNAFINNMIDWFDSYTYYAGLGVNAAALNVTISDLCAINQINLGFEFSLGTGILSITDNDIVVGLDEEVLANMSELPLFSEEKHWRTQYVESLVNVLKECSRPYDIVKIKSDITKDLGIYHRKSVSKLIRAIVNRRIDFVRVGVGYTEDDDRFAVIERCAVKPEDIDNYKIDEIIINENTSMTVQEKKEGLTKIVTFYKVSPFEKETGILLDVPIADFIEQTKVKEA